LIFTKEKRSEVISGIKGNKARDQLVMRELNKLEWRVVRVWEHEFKAPEKIARKLIKAMG
jgi:hypothetical protein